MRNINELIGIIKGINFDGVINDREVVRLQSWVDRNRNIAYEQKQVELIKIVDDVLADRIIDEEERKLLLSSAEAFLNEMGDTSSRIYELNGIIEGIICDGEVNEAEICNLKKWTDSNKALIQDHQFSREICESIESILEDGVVTEEEQEQLLELLSNQIRNSQFETKLEYLCRLVKERKNIGVELIDILNNDSAMAEIHRRAEVQLLKALNATNGYCADPEIIVVSLVLIAMLEYDGNYYGSVRATYTQIYAQYSEQRVEGLIRSILGRYKKKNDSGTRTRIINVALENAIVPKNFLAAFFEFMFDIYKLNFEYDLPEDPYEDFEFVYDGLRSNMLSDGDDISINVTQKTYKLIAATKQLIVKEDGIDAVIKLSILILKLIDKRFWDKEVKLFNPYLKAGYDGWEKQLKEDSSGKLTRRGNSGELRSRWEPKFVLENNAIYLVPPSHRVKSQYDYRMIEIIVSNGDEEIYVESDCDIREIIGGYQINPRRIVVDKPLGKLRYCLKCGDEIIYDSRDKFYRNHIVFGNDGQEIKNNTDFEGTAYFCYKAGDADLQNLLTKENYCIGFKLVRQGDAVQIGNDVFNFSSLIKPGVFGRLHENCTVIVDGDKHLPVYKEVDVVVFEADNKSNKFEISINDKHNKLSDMKYSSTMRENITKYVVQLDINNGGLYSVEVNQIISGKMNRLLKEEFVCDDGLNFVVDKIDESRFDLSVNSSIIETPVHTEVTIADEYPGIIGFDYKKHHCDYILPLDIGYYRIDEKEWNTSSSDLWIDDISFESKMKLLDSQCDGLLVYSEKGVLVEDNIEIIDKGAYKEIPIGFVKSYQAENKYVTLVFTYEGKKKYAVFCFNKCVIDSESTEVLFEDEPKRILVTPVFHGKNKVFFEVMNKNGEKIYTSKLLVSGQTETINNFNSFEEYTFNFHEKTKILMLRKNTLLHEIKKTFYAKEDFVGRVFKIIIAYFDQFRGDQSIEKEYRFNHSYLRFTGILDDGMFEAVVFVKTMKGEWDMFNINPVEVEICSDIVDDTMDVYMTNCGDGLLIDFEKHGIMNSLDHPTAPDIFLYTLSMKEA